MFKPSLLLLLTICFLHLRIGAQPVEKHEQSWRIMFYNVENYFDAEDDYETEDDEFLPVGFYHWTQAKFEKKRDDIANVIKMVGAIEPPALIGLCEVENRFVLEQLSRQTSLTQYGYAILHKDSPDVRGIDVALLYLPQHFKLIDSAFHTVSKERKTRDILYAKGILGNTDTLHIFVNHWSSKRGGENETEAYRVEAASTLRSKIDSILAVNHQANIIAMGDFNDLPNSKPILEGLRAKAKVDSLTYSSPYNLAAPLAEQGEGTSKYKGKWQLVDMMFCSRNLTRADNGIYCNPSGFTILKADCLLEEDKTYKGFKPKRTLVGPRYIGGASDHLPIYIDIWLKSESP